MFFRTFGAFIFVYVWYDAAVVSYSFYNTQGLLMIKKIVTVVLFCGLQGGVLLGMGAKYLSQNLDRGEESASVIDDDMIVDIDSLPRLCSEIMAQLVAQPEFVDDGDALRPENYKKLSFKSSVVGQIFAILNENLDHPLDVYVDCDSENENKDVLCTLVFRLPKAWEQPVDYVHIMEGYQKVIKKVKNGWTCVPSTHTGSFFDRRSIFPEKEWLAFVKEEKLQYEGALIMNLIEKFGLQDPVRVSDAEMWDVEPNGKVFLWIKRDTFDTFNRFFKFCYQLHSV